MARDIKDETQGRWRSVLTQLGIGEHHLTGKHTSCPMCGGTDRFRYDDKDGHGTYFCNNCGAGNGVKLVMEFLGLEFKEAAHKIREVLPNAPIRIAKATRPDSDKARAVLEKVWRTSHPLNGFCAASRYLQKRGLSFEQWPKMIRFHPALRYWNDDKTYSEHPAMVSRLLGPDYTGGTLHYTYLTPDGEKANVEKQKKLAPAKFPMGGACMLAGASETMGIAEGIETALSAMLLDGIPVWAATTAGGMVKWEPPQVAKNILIYADSDSSYTGQAAAFGLAHRLKLEGYQVDVKVPPELDVDWNDVLLAEQGA